MKIGPGISELRGVENRPLSLTWPVAYTTTCSTVQAVMLGCSYMQVCHCPGPKIVFWNRKCLVGILNKVLKCCQSSSTLTILCNADLENVTLATIKCFVPDSYLHILSSHCENTSQLNVLVSGFYYTRSMVSDD